MHGERTLLRAIAVIGLELHFSFKKRVYVLLHLTREFFYGVNRWVIPSELNKELDMRSSDFDETCRDCLGKGLWKLI